MGVLFSSHVAVTSAVFDRRRAWQELACLREKAGRRETRMIGILQFIHTTVWTVLFGKPADELQRSTESEDECDERTTTATAASSS